MLLKGLLHSLLRRPRDAREAARERTPADTDATVPGFNQLVRGRHGLYLANRNDIYIGSSLIHYGEYSELEWLVLARYCRQGDVVVEVGANMGAHTVALAKRVAPGGRVVAIEPQPIIFQTLCANLALNSLLNVDAFNCAVGGTRTVLRMPRVDYTATGNFGGVSLSEHGGGQGSRNVRVEPLDSLLSDYARVDLVKIDVEGMEEAALRSGAQVIERFRPVLYVENDRVEKSRSLIETLAEMGYRMWWHIPALFNSDNYFGNPHNLYPRIRSFNMLCVHRAAAPETPEGFAEITDSADHPLISRSQGA